MADEGAPPQSQTMMRFPRMISDNDSFNGDALPDSPAKSSVVDPILPMEGLPIHQTTKGLIVNDDDQPPIQPVEGAKEETFNLALFFE